MIMANQFDSIFVRKPKRNKFNLSFQNKLTCRFGELVPFLVQDVIPGDRFKVGNSHVIRLQPTVAPVMQNVMIYKHYFFVPNRLLWDEWETFITGGVSGAASPTWPAIYKRGIQSDGELISYFKPGSLSDFLGFPSPQTNGGVTGNVNIDFDIMPFLAYQLIYQEYYRDQNLVSEAIEFPATRDFLSSVNNPSDFSSLRSVCTLRRRAWKKDEFTSALPWPQRSPVGVTLPVNVDSTVSSVPPSNPLDGTPVSFPDVLLGHPDTVSVRFSHGSDGKGNLIADNSSGNPSNLRIDVSDQLKVTSSASLASISELRRAFKVQEWLEAMATGGSRYVEQIRRIFGVRTSDGRMQRPIYLGGVSTPLVMEQTAQTSATTSDSVQGNLSGNGASVSSDFVFKNRFEEHGYIIGIMSVIPRASYYQGVPQKYSRRNRYDFYWPQFAHIGEQPVTQGRLYFDFNAATVDSSNAKTFGYQPRYAEYRFNNDEIHGEFRTSLRQWHMARHFDKAPTLNRSFVEVPSSVADNVMAVSDYLAAPFLCLINNNILASRLVSKYGTPHL